MDRRTYLGGTAAVALAMALQPRPLAAETVVQEHVLGDPEAPVTIIEYSSLTCPHCAAFHTDTLPAIKERYIDTGQAKIIYRDFPLEQNALYAAVIAHCAGPDRYFASSRRCREPVTQGALPTRANRSSNSPGSRALPERARPARGRGAHGRGSCRCGSTAGRIQLARHHIVINGQVVSATPADEFATLIEAALPKRPGTCVHGIWL
jgi:hypothetical protein